MIRMNQLKLPVSHSGEQLRERAAKRLRVSETEIRALHIRRQSLDARKKPELFYSYVVDVELTDKARERQAVKRLGGKEVSLHEEMPYSLPKPGTIPLDCPPVIVGTGPAGLFCGLALARAGYRPILLERGEDADTRTARVEQFWEKGILDPECNVQFGEGGAGTFSDGKLNTLVKDACGRNHAVLRILTEFGADPAILYQHKPHIGTDVLRGIVKAIRREIVRLGGEVRFGVRMADVEIKEGRAEAVRLDGGERIPTQALVLALGHSARDTFAMLWERGIPMEAKAFAMGLRIQHPQRMIDISQYGREAWADLGPASYKVTRQVSTGRGVYSFCMCPGGYVVNASSEPGRLAVNGMSYHDRAGENANSALIVTVTPEDFRAFADRDRERDPLAGIAFQRELEARAFRLGGGRIPVQLWGDFSRDGISQGLGEVRPAFKGEWAFGNLREILPGYMSASLAEAMEAFGHMIKGFDRPDAVLAGVESRTSSPVRIPRDAHMESSVKGIFPCGEGAGYAGGITSAAMDGLKTAEELIGRYAPF